MGVKKTTDFLFYSSTKNYISVCIRIKILMKLKKNRFRAYEQKSPHAGLFQITITLTLL